MNENGADIDTKFTTEKDGNISYIRFDGYSTLTTCSSIVLSSCSSDEQNDVKHSAPILRWKRQKILNKNHNNTERPSSGDDVLNNLHLDQSFSMSAKENVVATLDEERRPIPARRLPPIPEDKLHRRNPHTVRQELKMFDDLIPETTLADVHLSEMPGLHNTEQWKRIAGRTAHPSPPLSRQYYQTVISTLDLQNGQVPQPLGSYRRPGRSENDQDTPTTPASRWRAPRRRIFLGSSVAVVLVAIVVAVVLAVTLVQKAGQTTTDYYSGNIYVNAKFESVLSNPSSSLARSYKREFCTLIGTTLANTNTKFALYYSTCSVIDFRNGSIIADFVLGFTRSQNVTRLNAYLNRTLVNQQLFGGTILSIYINSSLLSSNNTNSTDYENSNESNEYGDNNDKDDSAESGNLVMSEQNLTTDQPEPTRTTYTSVQFTRLETGLSITISETITITNNNLDKSPINTKNYELILVPTIDHTKTIVVPTIDINESPLPSPAAAVAAAGAGTAAATTTTTKVGTTNVVIKSPSHHNLLRPIKPIKDSNFAYIDESSDDHTFSSGDVTSTLEDLTTRDSTTSDSTLSLNQETSLNSPSTLVNNPPPPPTTKESSTQPTTTTISRPIKPKPDDSEEKQYPLPRPNQNNFVKRQRRMVVPKNQRRLLQYELMPTGKVYYVDRPYYNEYKTFKDNNNDENSSVILSTILSRSSSLDTLSDKHHRHRHRHHHHQQQQQQQNRKFHHDLTLKKSEQKLSIGGRLASNNNLLTTTSSTFKPISSNKTKRFSSFEPTPESLDRVFDVLIAADKRREEHEFWREKFDQRQPTTRPPTSTGRTHDTMNANTIPFHRGKQTHLTPNPTLNNNNNNNNYNSDNRSQSYTAKQDSEHNRQSGCLLEDCLRRRTLILQQQSQTQRNYSPNTIYSTNYPKQQLPPPNKLPLPTKTANTNQQPVRILPVSNGRVGRAPQARQTSDELSSISDVWATRSSLEDESQHPKKPINHARFQSTINRNRLTDQKLVNNKRASSVEQQKTSRTQNKNLSTSTKNKFFDLFKFNR